jgi:hypothetical protein
MKLMLIKRTDSFYKTQRFPKSFNSSTNWFEFCTVGFTLRNQKPHNYSYYGAFVCSN